jgi:hypothetical protein
MLIIGFLCCFFILGFLGSFARAQLDESFSFKHMRGAQLPLAPSPNSYAGPMPPVRYDQQLGWTFTDDFVSLAYNVTAVDQTDEYGYGPAYLLNGLSDAGYWYQVGVSYDWPYVAGGYNLGFGFNYQVFAPNQSSVYPRNGGGGLASFSGPVNSGDTILLELFFDGYNVVMFAGDYNTRSYAIEFFSAEGASYFQGLTSAPANSNGFFTGLMTEWYHPNPYYGDMSKVTYSNFDFAQSYAWMWMDEFDAFDPYWNGTWFATTPTPLDYNPNPTQMQTLSFQGATESSNAYQFITGSIMPLQTSITLVPSDQKNPISPTDGFLVRYIFNGQRLSDFAKNGTTTIKADSGTNVAITSASSDSTSKEAWVLNALRTNVTITPGTNSTFYYYDLLTQQVSYTVSGGGNPSNIHATYYSAPDVASEVNSLTRVDLPLSDSEYKTIMVAKGSTVSLPNVVPGSVNEQWILQGDSTWAASTPNQVPPRVIYSRQFLLSFAGSQLNSKWVNSGATTQVSLEGISSRTAGVGQRLASYSIDSNSPTFIQPTAGTTTISVYMNGPHVISINWVNQYQVILDPSISSNVVYATSPTISNDNNWYDQGTTVNFVLKSIISRSAGTGNRLATFTVNGVATGVSTPNPVSVISLNEISSPQTISGIIVKQFQFDLASGSLASITNSSLVGDSGWYDSGTLVNAVYNYSWNQTTQSRTNAVGYSINRNSSTPFDRSGNGTFQIQVVMTEPRNVTIDSTKQYPVFVTGGFNVIPSVSSPTKDTFYDLGTNLTFTTNTIGSSNGNSRQTIRGCTINDLPSDESNPDLISFTTPTIIFNSSNQLTFDSTVQYLISFNLFDNDGFRPITPDSLQIQTEQNKLDVSDLGIWLNAGTKFQIARILWENTDVKPNTPKVYTVTEPLNESLLCRIYNPKIIVKDYLGLPVADAEVALMLNNGTKLQTSSDSNGLASFQMIPSGTFRATAINLGLSASTTGDASTQGTSKILMLVSYPILALIVIAFVIVLGIFFRHKRARKSESGSIKH